MSILFAKWKLSNFLTRKYYVTLLPLLVIYILFIIIKHKNQFAGDEGRYWDYAEKLLNGNYASLDYSEYSYLWNGPGYPIVLMPFRYLNTPLLFPKLLNALFVYCGLLFFYRSSCYFSSKGKSLLVTLCLGLYYPFLSESLPILMTEALSFLCMCSFIFFLVNYYKTSSNVSLVLCSFTLAFLALTKVIFGYVILTILIVTSSWFFIAKAKKNIIRFIKVLAISLVFCSPYLYYTSSLTGKLLYWGNSGGMNLYWMSTPYGEEYGDWFFFETLATEQPKVYEKHKDYLTSIENLSPVEKDEELKRKAITNITKHKKKFIKNWISNISRIFLGSPHSYRIQSNNHLYYLFPNGILILALLIGMVLSILNYKKINTEIIFLMLFGLIYLGGISLLSALVRFLFPILPLLLIWIIYMFENFIKLGKGGNTNEIVIHIHRTNVLKK